MRTEEDLIKDKECKTCKTDKLQPKHWAVVGLSIYIIISAIIGTIHIVKQIAHQF
jgi:hypothetical protein